MGRGGKASEVPSQATDQSMEEDIPNLSEFIRDDFSAAQFANRALEQSATSAQAQIAQLEQSIRKVKEKLSAEVIRRQEDFLEKAASMRSAEESVQKISSSADTLALSLKRVADEILGPYKSIQLKTLQLKHIQASTEVLRQILQHVKLTQRLKALMGPAAASGQALSVLDLGKAAKILTEVTVVNEAPGLAAIDVVRSEATFLDSTRASVTSLAQEYLDKGMQATSQAEVGAALQVFFNLNQLPQAVNELIDSHVAGLDKLLSSTLDPKRLAGEASVSSSVRSSAASTRVQEVFWQRMAETLNAMHRSAVAVWHLQRVLVKKRDPLTHVLFLDTFVASSGDLPLQVFWPTVCRKLRAALENAISPGKAPLMRETMVQNFPNFASLVDTFFKKLYQETTVRGVEAAADKNVEALFGAALNGCENLYLGAVFTRVSDAITAAFPGGNKALPTSAELQKCIARIHEELKNAGNIPQLAATTTNVVGKALRVLAEKAEFMALAGSSEVRNVSGVCTTQQMRKIMLCNHLQEVSRSVAAFLPKLPAAASQNLREPIEVLEAGVLEAVMPLIKAILDRGESIILKMQQTDFGLEKSPAVVQTHPYVQELSRHLTHCRVEFLSKLSPPANPQNPSSVGAALVQRLASRLIVFFLRQAAMLRPLTPAGKAYLTKDLESLEEAVSANVWPVDKLARPHRMLQAFRKLLSLDTELVLESGLTKDLPAPILLLHLYSRAPEALQSPHTNSDLTAQQFSLWLDEHSGVETVKFIQSSLESCKASAEGQEGVQEIYDLMNAVSKSVLEPADVPKP